jgi:WhiB family redox-sensing transcriptional regulator
VNRRAALAFSPGAAGPLLGEPDPPWEDRAACITADPDLFFPEAGEHGGEQAKAVCASCPVRRECLEGALARNEKYGIWGGTSGADRRELRRQRSREALTEAA